LTRRIVGTLLLTLGWACSGWAQPCQVIVSPSGTTDFATSGDADRIDSSIAANPGKVVCLKDGVVFYLNHAVRLLGAGTVLRGQTQSTTNRPTLLLPPNQSGDAHVAGLFYNELAPTVTQPGGNLQNAIRTHSGLCPADPKTCVVLPDVGCPSCEISYLVINGNYGVTASGGFCRPALTSKNGYPLVWIGGTSASHSPNTGIKLHHCLIENVASYAGVLIEDGGASADVHDNGILNCGFNYQDPATGQGFWVDGIAIQALTVRVYNNALQDTTDGGIVNWKAGAKIYANYVSSVKRSGFGAINLVDDTDMRGVAVSGNHIGASGLGSFDVGIAVGRAVWNCPNSQNGWSADAPPVSDFSTLPGDPNPGITPGIYNNTFAALCVPPQPTPLPPPGPLSAAQGIAGSVRAEAAPQAGPGCTVFGFFNHPLPINGAANLKVYGNTFTGPAGQYGWYTGTGCPGLPKDVGQAVVEVGYCPTSCDFTGQTNPPPLTGLAPRALWNLIGGPKLVPIACR